MGAELPKIQSQREEKSCIIFLTCYLYFSRGTDKLHWVFLPTSARGGQKRLLMNGQLRDISKDFLWEAPLTKEYLQYLT